MKKVRPVVARNARELAKVLGLAPADGMEIEFRRDLNDKIIEVVAKKGLTHADVARLASHVTHSHDRHPEPQHPRDFNRSHATCRGLVKCTSKTPIQDRCLKLQNCNRRQIEASQVGAQSSQLSLQHSAKPGVLFVSLSAPRYLRKSQIFLGP